MPIHVHNNNFIITIAQNAVWSLKSGPTFWLEHPTNYHFWMHCYMYMNWGLWLYSINIRLRYCMIKRKCINSCDINVSVITSGNIHCIILFACVTWKGVSLLSREYPCMSWLFGSWFHISWSHVHVCKWSIKFIAKTSLEFLRIHRGLVCQQKRLSIHSYECT